MKNRLLVLLAALSLPFLVAPPAQAKWNGGSIRHAEDAGYNRQIVVECAGDRVNQFRGVREYQHSDNVCPSEDVDYVLVGTDMEIWCMVFTEYEKKWDARGWHKVGNFSNYKCVTRRD